MPEVNHKRWRELTVRKAMGILSLREKVEYLLTARKLGKEQVAEDEARARKAVAETEAEEKRLKTDWKYALEKKGKFHRVERIPYGRVVVDMRLDDGMVHKNFSCRSLMESGEADYAPVEFLLGYLDVLEKYGGDTDYVEAPFTISRGLFGRDPYAQRDNIERMLNAALSVRGMYYDGYAMRKC